MQAPGYDEQQVSEWLSRLKFPAFAWAVLFAVFAVGGSLLSPEGTQTADATSAHSPMGESITDDLAPAIGTPGAAVRAVYDAAVTAHEALDPVGAGLRTPP